MAVLQVVPNDKLDKLAQREQDILDESYSQEDQQADADSQLSAYIRKQYQLFRWHRNKFGLPRRYLNCLRAYNGQYNEGKLAEIKQFGGSEVWGNMTQVKSRGAAALLRDVFLSSVDRPWGLEPTPDPELPDDVRQNMQELLASELATMQNVGQQIDPDAATVRLRQLYDMAQRVAKTKARNEAHKAEDKLDDILREGKFYEALSLFITDLTIFPFAVLKGPEVRIHTEVDWVENRMEVIDKPKMFWRRVSPFDVYFTPGAERVEDADVIERIKLSRKDLNSLLGLRSYNDDAIRAVLTDYDRGMTDWLDEAETERANVENKENPYINDSEFIDTLEYHGAVKGEWLQEFGYEEIEDPDRDYAVTCWVIGRHVIKVLLNSNPHARHPYYATCFEKVPGSIYGNALPEILKDVQDVGNAAFRSLVNNMSISSGPQVMINEERLSPTTNPDTLYPWKRWRYLSDPMMSDKGPPVDFFQPQSNAQELLGVYKAMMEMADEVSAIPRYMTGSNHASGGAASTASGLTMLMNNASKVMQNIAKSIDDDILAPLLHDLYLVVMMTDQGGTLRGDETVVVKGVTVAASKETDRMRQLEFLQLTANPMDAQVIAPEYRAKVLRSIARTIGLPHDEVVPPDDEVQQKMQALQQQQAMMQQASMAQGQQAPAPSQPGTRPNEEFDTMHMTNDMTQPQQGGGPQ